MYQILIIDDEKMVIESIKGKIDWAYHQAVLAGCCNDGKEAIEMIRRVQPDIIILDMKMPVMDGRDLISYLNENGLLCEIIVSSAYTDFKYTQVAIQANVVDYLEKPLKKSQINEAIRKAVENIKAKQVSHLKNVLTERHYGINIAEPEKVCQEKKEYGMILLGLCSKQEKNGMRALEKKDLEDLEKDIEGICSVCMSALATVFYKKERLHEFVVIFSFHNLSINKNAIEIERFGNKIGKKLSPGFKGFFSWSGIFSSMSEISSVYWQLHRNMFFMNLNHMGVCRTEIVNLNGFSEPFVSEEMKRRMLLAAQRCEIKRIQGYLQEITQKYFEKDVLSMADIDSCWNTMIGIFSQAIDMDESGRHVQDINRVSWNPFYFSTVELIKNRFLESMEPFVCRIAENENQNSKQTVYQIKKDIEENYNQPLSLGYYSEMCFLSEEYLSKLFKQELGVNFIDYLIQVRLEKAERLLKNKELSISDIAYLVGYNDPKYFCRIFKKKYGKPPSMYR